MEAQIGGIVTSVANGQDGISLIHTADGSLSETQDILLRMRDLSVRASNEATLTSADLQRLQKEFAALTSEIARKSKAVTFNSKNLFNASFLNGKVLQIGPDNGTNFRLTVQISTVNTAIIAVNVGNLTLSTPAKAQNCISAVNSCLNYVSNVRAALGVTERRINAVINDLQAENINISAAKSRIMDADMAVEISGFTRLQILQQTGTAILAQANAQPQSILQLMK
jgi:flagellin